MATNVGNEELFTTWMPARSRRRSRHAATVELSNGDVLRVGPDEERTDNVTLSVSFDTEIPGGFGPGTIVLPRPEWVADQGAAKLLASVAAYDADSGATIYRGRVVGVSIGEDRLTLTCEGWAKHGEDDNTASMIFYDKDLSRWEGMPIERQEEVMRTLGRGPVDGSLDTSSGDPAVVCELEGSWTTLQHVEAWYDSGPANRIAAIDFAWVRGSTVNSADANWWWSLDTHQNSDGVTGNDYSTGNLRAAGPGSGTLTTSTDDQRYASAHAVYAAAGGGDGTKYSVWWPLLGVIGTHGLTLRGTVAAPAQGRGLLTSDIAEYIVGRWCPLWDVGPDSIETTQFVVPHCVFYDDTNANSMLEALALFGGRYALPLDWGVYEEFFMKTPGLYGSEWRVRRDEGARPDDDGPDSSEVLNGVKVTYDDGTGKKLSVGPVGSGADVETSDMENSDPENPANEDGARHWRGYEAGITDLYGAKLIGAVVLAQAANSSWRGTVEVPNTVFDSAGVEHGVEDMRAGDRMVVEDDDDTRPRFIRNTSYDGDRKSNKCSVGADPDRLDVLLARAGVVTTGRI